MRSLQLFGDRDLRLTEMDPPPPPAAAKKSGGGGRGAEKGLGLAYAFEPMVDALVRSGRLAIVLEAYAPTVPGYFLYFPRSAQTSAPLRLFIDAAKELARRRLS